MNIKSFLMNTYSFSLMWYGYKFLSYRIPMRIASIRPVKKKKVLFMSFNGKNYADNPKAVSEKLHEMAPEYEIVWGMKSIKKGISVVPSYVHVVRIGSWGWYRELATSGTWVVNVLLPNGILKRKGQRYIQTWHGDRAFKKIVFDATNDMEQFKKKNYFRRIIEPELCDLGTAGSDYGIMQYRSGFHYMGPLIECGIPRNDCLVDLNAETRDQIKRRLSIDDNTNVLLFAPTFRDHLDGKVQSVGSLDILDILGKLEEKTRKNWICIQRGHDAKLEYRKEYYNRVLDMTDYEDIADLLCITDLLITDYSSMHGDLALTGHGTIFFQDDYDDYISKDRQLYFDVDRTPFWIAHTQKEVISFIEKYDESLMQQNAKEILDFYNTFETGRASEAVVNYILDGSIPTAGMHTTNKFME